MCDRYVWTGSDGGKNAASFPLRLTWLVIRFIAFGSAHVFFQTETTTPVTKPDWIEHSEWFLAFAVPYTILYNINMGQSYTILIWDNNL